MRARTCAGLWCGLACATAIAAAPPVFDGDPVNPATGQAWIIQPGLPLIDAGPDGLFRTADDVYDPSLVGDVDVVIRTGGAYAGGPIPGAAASVATAPEVVAGGHHGGDGTLAPFQLIVSDGATPPATGNLLAGTELDARRALVAAFPDFDGDGFIGPTAVAAAQDREVERQEALTLAGRTMVEISHGVASGQIGVTVAAPASAGGLGMLVAGGSVTGATPNLYTDGPWISTRLPFMLPRDPLALVGGEATGPIDAIYLVDLEIGAETLYMPGPNDPVLGTPFAVPLGAASVSNDLLRAVSGPPVGAGFGALLDRTTFVAGLGTVVRPLVDGATRELMTPIDALSLPADGPGNARTVLVYPADLLGNQTDPPPGGMTITLEVGPGLAITSPDSDGDPRREPITFAAATWVPVTIDDAGPARPTALDDHLVALRDGVPTATVAVTVEAGPGGGPVPGSLPDPTARIGFSPKPGKDAIAFAATVPADAATLAAAAASLDMHTNAGALFTLDVPAGALRSSMGGKRFVYTAPPVQLALARRRDRLHYALKLRVAHQDLAGTARDVNTLTARVTLGPNAFEGTAACVANRGGSVTTCRP